MSASQCDIMLYLGMQANLDVMSWELGRDDYIKLCNLHVQMRMVNGSFWLHPKGPYRTLGDLWDDNNEAAS